MIGLTPVGPAQPSGHYAQVNGLRMYYEIHGSGFPLVLIHGGGSTIGSSFGRILPALAKHHKVIAVELQAHGHTADIDRPLSFSQDADDVAVLLSQLDIDKADVFGFSNGASTALEIAIRHPELVNRVIIASTMYKRNGAYPWLWELMEKPKFSDMPKVYKDAYLEINPDSNALRRMFERDSARMQHFTDIGDAEIAAIAVPVLIIIGDREIVRPEHAVEMYRRMQHARLVVLPGGHGEYMGEIATLKPDHTGDYPAVAIIEAFLSQPVSDGR